MTKQPFTPAGLQAKLAELYVLSDPNLLLEAKTLSNDLKIFLNNHFTFSTAEQDYISAMDDRTTFGLGTRLSTVLLIRGPIIMNEVPTNTQPRRPKEIILIGDGTLEWNDASGIMTGTLRAEIDWLLLP